MDLGISTSRGRSGLASIVAEPERALLAFDYDGTLAPIVADPSQAIAHPPAVDGLRGVAARVGAVAVVTGRPVDAAVRLGGLAGPGLERLVVLGHYGLERWDAAGGLQTSQVVAGVDAARAELPGLLASLGLGNAFIEDKRLSVAVHVRNLPDPEAALRSLRLPLQRLAQRCGLLVEPGKLVIELRPTGMDKGKALRQLVEDTGARSVAFFGDDLGDLAAFDEVDRLRGQGVPGLLVCSGSAEERALAPRADLVVDGPAGVAQFLGALIGRLGPRQLR